MTKYWAFIWYAKCTRCKSTQHNQNDKNIKSISEGIEQTKFKQSDNEWSETLAHTQCIKRLRYFEIMVILEILHMCHVGVLSVDDVSGLDFELLIKFTSIEFINLP